MLCPVCDARATEPFYDCGLVPLFVNVLHTSRAEALGAPRGRLELVCCSACGHVWNGAFEPERLAYAPGYENSLHGSPTFVAWAESRARALVTQHALRGARAVDVGGGRGEFAALLVAAGAARALVVDPSAPDEGTVDAAGAVQVERRLFRPTDVDAQTRLLLSRHVLEHIAQPRAFMAALVAAGIGARAGVYVEVPNALFTLRDLGVWDLIYEHCGYYTPSSLRALCRAAGLTDASIQEEFHAQFLAAEAPSPARAALDQRHPEPAEVVRLARRFGESAAALVRAWSSALAARRGRRIALWGVGAKGATFLGRIPGAERVLCGVDVNARKHGRYVSGSGHPIVAPQDLAGLGVDVVIVLNPAYVGEVRAAAEAVGLQGIEVLTAPDPAR